MLVNCLKIKLEIDENTRLHRTVIYENFLSQTLNFPQQTIQFNLSHLTS